MELTFLGCGDAFGSGGRFNTCFHLKDARGAFLVDCGASSMIAIRKLGVDPNEIRAIVISHLHGDHFGGLPFFILDAQLVSGRAVPLTIAGPPGLRAQLDAAMEALFPGSSKAARKFQIEIVELEPGLAHDIFGARVTPFVVEHPCGAPPFALRIEVEGKVFCYSGDTGWVENLIEAARDADLFVAEAYAYDKSVKFHLDFATLKARLPEIAAKRVILTHMSADMLARIGDIDCEAAADGLKVAF